MTSRYVILVCAAATALQLPGSFKRESVKVYRGGDFPAYQNPTSRDEPAWAPDDTSDAMAEKAPNRRRRRPCRARPRARPRRRGPGAGARRAPVSRPVATTSSSPDITPYAVVLALGGGLAARAKSNGRRGRPRPRTRRRRPSRRGKFLSFPRPKESADADADAREDGPEEEPAPPAPAPAETPCRRASPRP